MTAAPTRPVSASTLLHSYQNRFSQRHSVATISTACRSIDSHALCAQNGGLLYGSITAIEGGKGCGKTLIAMHIITTHLKANPSSQVAWIDTTNNFSAARLLSVVKERLKPPPPATHAEVGEGFGYYEKIKPENMPTDEQLGMLNPEDLLERVQVMRVFDIHGVIEAMEEVNAGFQRLDAEVDAIELAHQEQTKTAEVAIADSEGEEDEELDEEEFPEDDNAAEKVMAKGIGVLIIDNISGPITSLLEKGEIEGNALLESLSRSLASLARTRNLSILVLSVTTPPTSPSRHQNHSRSYSHHFNSPQSTSVFASLPAYSSGLGLVMSFAPDLTVLLSRFPTAREIWKIHATTTQGLRDTGEVEKDVFVFEVLTDRKRSGEGRWALFGMEEGFALTDIVK